MSDQDLYPFQSQWQCPCGSRDFITDVMRPGLLCTNCGLEILPEVLEAMAQDRDTAKARLELDIAIANLDPPLAETPHEQSVAKLLEIIAEAKAPKLDPMGENMSTELKRREEILTRAKLAGSLQLKGNTSDIGGDWDVCGEQPLHGPAISPDPSYHVYHEPSSAYYDREVTDASPLPAAASPEPAGEFSEGMHTHLPSDAQARKDCPVVTGLLDYFPLACAYVGHVSKVGNDQHNPGQSMHWAREKSTDHADCVGRHLSERGTRDKDGLRHSGKVAWRALALLQTELENDPEW